MLRNAQKNGGKVTHILKRRKVSVGRTCALRYPATRARCACIWTPLVSYLCVAFFSRCTLHMSEMLRRPVSSARLRSASPLVAEAKTTSCKKNNKKNFVRKCLRNTARNTTPRSLLQKNQAVLQQVSAIRRLLPLPQSVFVTV